MPHKHRRIEEDESQFNLPPTIQATSLPVGKARTFSTTTKGKKRKIAHVDGYGADDTPKAFQRLMSFSKGGMKKRSALDDGTVKTKKQRKQQVAEDAGSKKLSEEAGEEPAAATKPVLKIQPGESMAEFRARVDQALPLSGVAKSGKKIAGISDHRVTKHERRLKRLQKGWREEEERIREKEMEERELAEEEQDEIDAMWEDKTSDLPGTSNGKKRKNKKAKRKRVVGEVSDGEDEWEALQRQKKERKGLHDVVHAPPTFDKVPREIFKVKNGAGAKVGNVPNSAGSLRKREELGEERKTIIDTYRELMAAKRKTQ